MTAHQPRRSRLRRGLLRGALCGTAAAAALGLTATDAMALPSGTTAATFTLSQPDWYAGASAQYFPEAELIFQSDGNLVLYAMSDTQDWPLWASGTNGKGVTHVDWSQSGFIRLEDSNNNTICTVGALNPAPGGTARVQADSNFVFYDTNGNPTWASNTNNQHVGNRNYCYT